MIHTADTVLPIAAEPIADGAVLVHDGRIAAVGTAAELTAAHPGTPVRPWRGILTPGLVNAHAHLQYTEYQDLAAEPTTFGPWITEVSKRRLTYDDAMWARSALAGRRAMLRTGTTAVADIVTEPAALPAAAGLPGISYLEIVICDDQRWADTHRKRLLDALDSAPADRAVGVSPHALYTLSTGVVQASIAVARERGLRLHPHLAETLDEERFVRDGNGPLAEFAKRGGCAYDLIGTGSGLRPVALLDKLGGLGPDTHIAHGVHCDAADRALLRERGVTVAVCVRSNAVLTAGEPPLADYLRENSPLALGTDSLASSPSLDLLAEATAARELARRQGYTEPDLDRRLITAATRGGATAMGRTDIGTLTVGSRADLAVFEVPRTADPYRALLDFGAGRCVATMLAGSIEFQAGT
ncbi:amidohydrolase [Pseudonocardiaceae bacterium YIM PH 21723]|nr:amidohydrolase [Pseudonocardiaceae bacterium YIM PH 21723]